MKLKKALVSLSDILKQRHQKLVASLITFTVALSVLGLRGTGVLELIELKTLDYLIRARPAEKTDNRIVIVEISEDDIQSKSEWPWTDQIFADLITQISAADPVAIGIDKYLDIPVGEGRDRLILATQKAGNVVNATLLALQNKGVDLPKDLAAVSESGFVNIPTDSGSVVRRALLAVDNDSFAFKLAQMYLKQKANLDIDFDSENKQFSINDQVIPRIDHNYGGYRNLDASGYQILLNFRGDARKFEHVSAVDVLAGKVNHHLLRDRIVLLGVTAVSLKDSYPTPYSTGEQVTYGVEIHANIISQIISAALDGRPYIRVWSDQAESLWIVIWTVIGGTLAISLSHVGRNLIILVGGALGLSFAVWLAFVQAWWLPLFPAITGLITANMLVIAYQFSQEQVQRRMLMTLFSRHVSKELVNIIWTKRDQFMQAGRIAGQEVYVTVMFTDMRNFSTSAEEQEPSQTLDWLNEYLGAIATEILAHGGMVDKYIGDSVMAVFGVPVPHKSEKERCRDAQHAVTAALNVAKKLSEMNATWQKQGLSEVVTGIGINSGRVIAGSLGNEQRLEYSVIGDVVNVAARLESLNKEVDGGQHHILISQDTYDRLNGQFITEFAGNHALKGRTAATPVYRVLDFN